MVFKRLARKGLRARRILKSLRTRANALMYSNNCKIKRFGYTKTKRIDNKIRLSGYTIDKNVLYYKGRGTSNLVYLEAYAQVKQKPMHSGVGAWYPIGKDRHCGTPPDASDYRSCLHGFCARLEPPRQEPDLDIVADMNRVIPRFMEENFRKVRPSDIFSLTEFIAGRPSNKRGALVRTVERVNTGSREFLDRMIESLGIRTAFIKEELYKLYTAFRNIMNPSDLNKLLFGYLFKILEKVVFENKNFVKTVPGDKRAEYVPRHLGEWPVYLETDHTAFESAFTPLIMKMIEHAMYEWLIEDLEEDFKAAYGWMFQMLRSSNVIKTPYGKMSVKGKRLSGETNTSLWNGIVNFFLVWYLFDKQNTPFSAVFEGDDGLIGCSEIPDFGILKGAGFLVKLDTAPTIGQLSFCGLKFASSAKQMLRDPYKVLSSFSYLPSRYVGANEETVKAYFYVKAASYLWELPSCPMITAYSRAVLEKFENPDPNKVTKVIQNLSEWQQEKAINAFRHLEIETPPILDDTRYLFEESYGITLETQLMFEKDPLGIDIELPFPEGYSTPEPYAETTHVNHLQSGLYQAVEDQLLVVEGKGSVVKNEAVRKYGHSFLEFFLSNKTIGFSSTTFEAVENAKIKPPAMGCNIKIVKPKPTGKLSYDSGTTNKIRLPNKICNILVPLALMSRRSNKASKASNKKPRALTVINKTHLTPEQDAKLKRLVEAYARPILTGKHFIPPGFPQAITTHTATKSFELDLENQYSAFIFTRDPDKFYGTFSGSEGMNLANAIAVPDLVVPPGGWLSAFSQAQTTVTLPFVNRSQLGGVYSIVDQNGEYVLSQQNRYIPALPAEVGQTGFILTINSNTEFSTAVTGAQIIVFYNNLGIQIGQQNFNENLPAGSGTINLTVPSMPQGTVGFQVYLQNTSPQSYKINGAPGIQLTVETTSVQWTSFDDFFSIGTPTKSATDFANMATVEWKTQNTVKGDDTRGDGICAVFGPSFWDYVSGDASVMYNNVNQLPDSKVMHQSNTNLGMGGYMPYLVPQDILLTRGVTPATKSAIIAVINQGNDYENKPQNWELQVTATMNSTGKEGQRHQDASLAHRHLFDAIICSPAMKELLLTPNPHRGRKIKEHIKKIWHAPGVKQAARNLGLDALTAITEVL